MWDLANPFAFGEIPTERHVDPALLWRTSLTQEQHLPAAVASAFSTPRTEFDNFQKFFAFSPRLASATGSLLQSWLPLCVCMLHLPSTRQLQLRYTDRELPVILNVHCA